MKRIAILSILVLACSTFTLAQQDKSKRPSPPAQAECKLASGKSIKIDYSSPRMKGRKIYGSLVPYGQVWRAGANEATTLVSDTGLSVGGKDVAAGTYSLFTLPTESKWTLIVSKKTGEWGVPYPGEGDDLLRADMQVSKLGSPMENFTISLTPKGNACTLQMDWESTRASIDLTEKK
jgi:hypothetical protein